MENKAVNVEQEHLDEDILGKDDLDIKKEDIQSDDDVQEIDEHDTNAHEHDNNEAVEMNESSTIIKDLMKQLDVKQQEIKQQKDSVLRAAAEVDNVKKRAAIDVEKAHKFALEKLIKELLPTVDSLERALETSVENNEHAQTILEGTELTLQSFLKALNKFGCHQVDPIGQPFDPELHQAIAMQPSDKYPNNHVMNVMQKGYTLNDRLLRPAMVIVVSES